MRLEYSLKADAQAVADKTHAWLIANNPFYAKSVADGKTLRWDVPRQQTDASGKVIAGSPWSVFVKDKALSALAQAEVNVLKEPTLAATAMTATISTKP